MKNATSKLQDLVLFQVKPKTNYLMNELWEQKITKQLIFIWKALYQVLSICHYVISSYPYHMQ